MGKIAFNIPFVGSILLLFYGASIFLIAVLGLALFISTFSGTQQQYMFIAFLLHDNIHPYERNIHSVMKACQAGHRISILINPVAYLMRINRMVMLKGSTMHDISREIISLDSNCCLFYNSCCKTVQEDSLRKLNNLFIIYDCVITLLKQLPLPASGLK